METSVPPHPRARALVSVVVVVAGLAACGLSDVRAPARVVSRIASPDGRSFVEVRALPAGGEALHVNGVLAWPKQAGRSASVTVAPRWARGSDAVAFLARERQATRLVVVLVRGAASGQTLEWVVPREALPAKVITWIDARRVSVGAREMEPKLVASWDAPR